MTSSELEKSYISLKNKDNEMNRLVNENRSVIVDLEATKKQR